MPAGCVAGCVVVVSDEEDSVTCHCNSTVMEPGSLHERFGDFPVCTHSRPRNIRTRGVAGIAVPSHEPARSRPDDIGRVSIGRIPVRIRRRDDQEAAGVRHAGVRRHARGVNLTTRRGPRNEEALSVRSDAQLEGSGTPAGDYLERPSGRFAGGDINEPAEDSRARARRVRPDERSGYL